MKRNKLAIVGLGKLGCPLALVFARASFKVVAIDIKKDRIEEIQSYLVEKCLEPSVSEYLAEYGDRISFSTDYAKLKDVPIVFVIVQTPSLETGMFDIHHVTQAVQQVHDVNKDCLIVVSSNINIGTINQLHTIHPRICYNPEFIKQGSIIHDFEHPKFVVIGAYTQEDAKTVANAWRQVFKNVPPYVPESTPIFTVKPVEAETVKLCGNVSFCLGITFANIIGEICEKFNADPNKVLDIIYQDRRNYKPGLGFGGPCFPKDVECLHDICRRNRLWSGERFSRILRVLNNQIVDKYVRKIKAFNKDKVGILGVAYKLDVPYVYESQALEIARRLVEDGLEVYVYDRLAMENARQVVPDAHYCATIEECVENGEVIFVGTSNFSDVKCKKPIINPWK